MIAAAVATTIQARAVSRGADTRAEPALAEHPVQRHAGVGAGLHTHHQHRRAAPQQRQPFHQ